MKYTDSKTIQEVIRVLESMKTDMDTLDMNGEGVLSSGSVFLENENNGIMAGSEPLYPTSEGEDIMAHKFQQRVVVGKGDDGRDVIKWAVGNTQRELQASICRIWNEFGLLDGEQGESARESESPARSEVLYADYAQNWFDTFKETKLKGKTATTRRNFFKLHVLTAFPGKAVTEISPQDVQAVLNAKKEFSRAYLRDIMGYMSGVFEAAKEEGLIKVNPMKSRFVFNPSGKVTERSALTEAEKTDIIASIPRLESRNDRMEMAFLMFTPLRPGEIFALRWEDIDPENGLIHIRRGSSFNSGKIVIGTTKTAAGMRDIPLDECLMDILSPMGDNGFILSRDGKHEGEPYSEQTAKNAWSRIKRTIDVHGMTPYVGRHTYLTEAHHAGIDMKTLQAIAGHADERMLMRVYVHSNEQYVREAGKKMQEHFKGISAS